MTSQTTRIRGNVSGVFNTPDGGIVTGVGTNTFTWGEGSSGSPPNNLIFTGVPFDATFEVGTGVTPSFSPYAIAAVGYTYGKYQGRKFESAPFSLGSLFYFNGTTRFGTEANSVSLDVTLNDLAVQNSNGSSSFPGQTTFKNSLTLNSTTNIDGDREASADYVRFPSSFSDVSFATSTGAPLTLKVEGFGKIDGQGFVAQTAEGENQFRVYEGERASAELVGRFVDPIEEIVKDSVRIELTTNGTAIEAYFTPKNGNLEDAKRLGGYAYFNWYQTIDRLPESIAEENAKRLKQGLNPVFASRQTPRVAVKAPLVDSPSTGWSYWSDAEILNDTLPFYYDEQEPSFRGDTRKEQEVFSSSGRVVDTLQFFDQPRWTKIKPGEYMFFTTSLVGVLPNGKWQALYTFRWKTNFKGTSGQVSLSTLTPEASDGTQGGIADLQLDVNPASIPVAIRRIMEADGALNASGAAATPLAPIDFSRRRLGERLNGTNRSDRLSGTNKNDIIRGNGKRDFAFGQNGNDQIEGGKGNDQLTGGAGDDVIIGNAGNDTLTGGRGKDLFTFNQVADKVDTIIDFKPSSDLLDLRKIFASSAFAGVDIFSRFTEFLQAVPVGANTQIQIDADGAGIGTDFTRLAVLKNVAASSINSRSFVIG